MENIQDLYLKFGSFLIDIFNGKIEIPLNFNINIEDCNGYISDGNMTISYMPVQEEEQIYVYSDINGMVCFNTKYFEKNFIIIETEIYYGYEGLKKEPLEYIQEVLGKIKKAFSRENVRSFHI